LPTCPACTELYGWREPPEQPPCETCRIELEADNYEAADIYLISRGQVITRGMDGMIWDIDNQAIESAMRMKGVKDPWNCLIKVRRVFHHLNKG
jgi:hypothetical protein